MSKRRRDKGNNSGQLRGLPSAGDILARQMAEASAKATATAIVQEVNQIIGVIRGQLHRTAMKVAQNENQISFLMQTVDLIKTGLADKGLLTDKDLEKILAKVLEQQEKAKEILGNEEIDDAEKTKQLVEEAGLEQGPAENLLKTYNDAMQARRVAEEKGTTFEPIVGSKDGEDDSPGDETEGQDGSGDQGSGDADLADGGDPGSTEDPAE